MKFTFNKRRLPEGDEIPSYLSTHEKLKLKAVAAHNRGQDWHRFWHLHKPEIDKAEPYNALRYHKLVRKLMLLVWTGDAKEKAVETPF